MRILYDSLGFEEPWGGVPRYFAELIRNLPDACEPRLAVAATPHAELRQPPFKIPAARQCVSNFLPGVPFPGKRRLYLGLARIFPWVWPSSELANTRLLENMLQEPFDLAHLTAPHRYGSTWRRIVGRMPIVLTVHDLIPELVYGDRRTRDQRQEILSAATAVIAVSQNTRTDILNTYDVDERKVVVVHHGVDASSFGGRDMLGRALAGDFLLYVGKRDGYKNWSSFVQFAAPWVKECSSRGIVCVGKPFDTDEKRMIAELGLVGRIEARTATDDELKKLYQSAFAFVYPSLHEGFGLPVLEAMAARCPVILSDIQVLHEVAGDAALYFSGADDFGLALSLLNDSGRRVNLVTRGVQRAEFFTWGKCASETAEVYRRVVAGDFTV